MEETQPLLAQAHAPQVGHADRPLVDFDPAGDPDNPLEWQNTYKRGVILLLAFMAFTVTFTCIGIVPVAEQIALDLEGKESKSASILVVTVWELGEAAGPLLIAPLSEIYGRYPVFNFVNLFFILGVVLSACSQTTNLLIFSRFITGLAVASNVLNPSIVGDIFPSESRGSAMSLIMLAPLLGGAIGPAISGAIAESMGWRTILWISAAMATVCEILFFTLFRETYKVPILQRKAARLRKESQDESFKCAWDTEVSGMNGSWWSALRLSIKVPITILLDSTVLQIMSFYGAFVFAFYYILATTLPTILRENYGFTPSMIGSSFLCFSIGATAGIILNNMFLDKIYINMGKSRGRGAQPEYRLPLSVCGAIVMPLVVALYGCVPSIHGPIYLMLLSVSLLGLVMMTIFVPLSSYIVDAFGLHSASAMTMMLLSRCLGGTLLPLAVPAVTMAVGLGYAFLILAAICVILIPFPMLIMRYGNLWRERSVYSRTE
ncbi:major facilitator superfamily domain-containing protein [Bisporella sp. PMI_857]|nr:major facilitator superfamily domain-containing protein [Bisporella sp. PMI_857]